MTIVPTFLKKFKEIIILNTPEFILNIDLFSLQLFYQVVIPLEFIRLWNIRGMIYNIIITYCTIIRFFDCIVF
ncbi:MAG: hypothetical protein CMJ52_00465 [Planctomycetaceae bacterium]|nr:hypothetical protein [Planctomycetaceae bacterium]